MVDGNEMMYVEMENVVMMEVEKNKKVGPFILEKTSERFAGSHLWSRGGHACKPNL